MEVLLSATEAAKVMGLSRRQVGELCRRGKLPGARKVGLNWAIPMESVENYVPGPQGFAAHPDLAREVGRGKSGGG